MPKNINGWIVHAGFNKASRRTDLDERFIASGRKLEMRIEPVQTGIIGSSPELVARWDLPDFAILQNKNTSFGRILEDAGVLVVNSPGSIELANSKIATANAFWRAGVSQPKTVLDPYGRGNGEKELLFSFADMLEQELGFPMIVKEETGYGGSGVHLVRSKEDLILSDMFSNARPHLVFQQFLPECFGTDIRIGIIAGEYAGAIRRVGAEGDFRSNMHAGGHAEPYEPTAEEKALAIAAANATGLEYSGVDVLQTNEGPVICEVNSSPLFSAIEDTCFPFSETLLEYIRNVISGKRMRIPVL